MTKALKQADVWQCEPLGLASNTTDLTNREWKEFERLALFHYEKSINARTLNEQTVTHRGAAKDYANRLLKDKAREVTALNLLARIALDEGFYNASAQYLKDALTLNSEDAGCWYSMGHLGLATKDYDSALECFSRSLAIAPNQTRAETSLAYTLARKGQVVEAFQAYRKLFRTNPLDNHVQAKLFEILKNIQADYYQPDLEIDVIRWLKVKNMDLQALAPLVMSLLIHKYSLNDANAVIDLQDLAKDQMLNLALGKLYFINDEIEKFITLLRKHVLLNCIDGSYKDQHLLKLAGRLALHSEHNEQVYQYDADEKTLVNKLASLLTEVLQSPTNKTHDSAPLFTLYAMYEPLITVPGIDRLSNQNLTDWPAHAKRLIQHVVVNAKAEVQLMATIEKLGPISDSISVGVKQQYEENPYPRWLHLSYNTPTNYGRALETELIGFRAPEFFNMGSVKFLIAGAGTGQHALKVARYFRNAEVLAIDLSSRSLAYAKRMAVQHQISNIRFLNCDILELDQLDEQFHVIECSGVLHHMKNPDQGLAALKARLAPKGLIKLGLYSYQAREVVRQMRDLITRYDLPPTAEGIRTLRQAILEGKMPYDFSGLKSSQDFYSLSGCRDLLFHVHEFQYEPLELKAMIERQQLEFLGFVVPESVRADYGQRFPDDPRMVDLSHWQAFEQEHPALFAGMFQFYLQSNG